MGTSVEEEAGGSGSARGTTKGRTRWPKEGGRRSRVSVGGEGSERLLPSSPRPSCPSGIFFRLLQSLYTHTGLQQCVLNRHGFSEMKTMKEGRNDEGERSSSPRSSSPTPFHPKEVDIRRLFSMVSTTRPPSRPPNIPRGFPQPSIYLNPHLFLASFAHVLLSPDTKVEESFSLHAIHDFVIYGYSLDNLSKVSSLSCSKFEFLAFFEDEGERKRTKRKERPSSSRSTINFLLLFLLNHELHDYRDSLVLFTDFYLSSCTSLTTSPSLVLSQEASSLPSSSPSPSDSSPFLSFGLAISTTSSIFRS